MLEVVSKFLHEECWEVFAKGILETEKNLSPERTARWRNDCFMPYEQLSEEMKEKDRDFARKLLPILDTLVQDRYIHTAECVRRLVREHIVYGKLFVAFDFDNTVFDYHNTGESYPKVEAILRRCVEGGHILILFSSNEGDRLQEIVRYCRERGYAPEHINENPVAPTRKQYYNILLDDRAGLGQAQEILTITLDIIKYGIQQPKTGENHAK
jgi:hypothetical protein